MNAFGVDGAGIRAVVEKGCTGEAMRGMGAGGPVIGATCGALGGAGGAAACTRTELRLITASGFIGSRELRGALGGGGGIAAIASLDTGCSASGGGIEWMGGRGIDGGGIGLGAMLGAGARGGVGGVDAGFVETTADFEGATADEPGAIDGAGGRTLAGTFGAAGGFGAIGGFAA